MPRPCKRRRICDVPHCGLFGPKDGSNQSSETVNMTFDEFESIRLIDLDGMTQEQCAAQMGVARTTAQSIYNSARRKLAQFIVNRTELSISGGEYVLCDGSSGHCRCEKCRKACRRTADGCCGEGIHRDCCLSSGQDNEQSIK